MAIDSTAPVARSNHFTCKESDWVWPMTQAVKLWTPVLAWPTGLRPSTLPMSRATAAHWAASMPLSERTRVPADRPSTAEAATHSASPSRAQRMGTLPCSRSTAHIQSQADTAAWLSCNVWSKALTSRTCSMCVRSFHSDLRMSSLDSHSEGVQRKKGAGCIRRTQTSSESRSACARPCTGMSHAMAAHARINLDSDCGIKVSRGLGRVF